MTSTFARLMAVGLVLLAAVEIVAFSDVRWTTFEDGSIRVTACLPWRICALEAPALSSSSS